MNSRLIIYKASAGSGKTFTLAANYISYLLANPEAYRHLLAVTFTNKATGEMKERILSQLYGISHGLPESDDYLRAAIAMRGLKGDEATLRTRAGQALTSLLHNFSAFRIETIDSFMLSILRGLAKELELGHGMEIELDTTRVTREGVHDFIEGLQLDSPEMVPLMDFMESSIDDAAGWDVTRSLRSFAENLHKETFLRHSDEMEELIRQQPEVVKRVKDVLKVREDNVKKDVQIYVDRFFDFCNDNGITVDKIKGKGKSPYTFFEKLRMLSRQTVISSNEKWPNITVTIYKYINDASEWGTGVGAAGPMLSDILAETVRCFIRWKQTYNTSELVRRNLYQLQLLGSIDAKIAETCRRDNRFLLADTCLMLMKMASGPGDTAFIYEKTGTTIDHILIDEFQDTSGLQWANFRPLLAENAARGKQGLIVGDVKQAIYRWRNSDADIMARQVEDDMRTAEPHTKTLQMNRRSRQRIVEFNNRFFTTLVERLTESATPSAQTADLIKSAYSDVEQEWKPENTGGCVKILEMPNEDRPEAVAAQVVELLDEGVPPNEIAILTRKNFEIGLLAEWFETHPEALAPYTVRIVSGEAYHLESSDAVRMLVAAMRWVKDEDDIVSLAQVGIGYHRLVAADGLEITDVLALKESRYGLPDAFATQHDTLAAQPLGTLAYSLYDALEMRRMKGQAAWMQTFFDTVQKFASKKEGTLGNFLDEWDDTLCKVAIPSGEADGIVGMTFHKAKGLEFHSVIIPYCDWKLEKNPSKDTQWVEVDPEAYEGMTCLPVNRLKVMEESDFAEAYDRETGQIWLDNLNLLYVAFTRPKANLIIMKDPPPNTLTTIAGFVELGLTSVSGEQLAESEENNANPSTLTANPITANPNPLLPHSEELGVGFHAEPLRLTFRQSNRSKTYINRGDDSPLSEFIEQGNLLHEVFARIRTAADVPRAVDDLFTQGIINKAQRTEIAEFVSQAVQQPGASDWFSGKYELFNECTILTTAADGTVKQLRPDRVMRAEGRTVVVDFKFGQPHAEHKRQVGNYMQRLREMGFEGVEGYLWYVKQQNIVCV